MAKEKQAAFDVGLSVGRQQTVDFFQLALQQLKERYEVETDD
jgi:hypothetical protein